jgi:ClpP class serine protease
MPNIAKPNQRFAPIGLLALQPQAFGALFAFMREESEPEPADGVCVVNVRGPLMHHCEWFFDSYEDIKARVANAISRKPNAIVLSIDSPGGVVSGCFDTARELRAMCALAGVPLFAHIGGSGTSAAYALATAASHISASQTAMVGSVGIIDTLVDVTQQNALYGVNIKLISSGARKTDGNPNVPISDEAMQASQDRVGQLADMFFALCEEHGYSNANAIRELQANVFTGDEAARLGLVNAVASLDQTIALAKQGSEENTSQSGVEKKGTSNMATPMENARAALQEAADGDNEEEASKAKKALAALDASDEETAEGDEENAGDEGDEETAEGDEETPPPKDEKKEGKAKASKGGNALALQAMAEIHELKAERAREREDKERADLIASRPDFSDEMIALLQTEPIATVRKMVSKLKKGPNLRKPNTAAIAAAATVAGARGANQGTGTEARSNPEIKAQLDAQMGLTANAKVGVRNEANKVVFGVALPKEG